MVQELFYLLGFSGKNKNAHYRLHSFSCISPMFVHEVQGKDAPKQSGEGSISKNCFYTDSRQQLWLLVLQISPQCLTHHRPSRILVGGTK